MKNALLLVALAIIGWQYYAKSSQVKPVEEGGDAQAFVADPPAQSPEEVEPAAQFSCDGRIYCSQMTSCEEAEYFLENCPGVKMDGEGDGVPCERRWCGHR